MALAVLALLPGAACRKWNELPPSNTASGTIEVDETQVASRYGGRVEEVLAREGDALAPGQVIARLDAAELRARRDQAAALLEEWKAGPRPEELDSAKSDWQALVSDWEFARADHRRSEELFAQKAISETERDRALTRARSLEKSVAASRGRYDLLAAGTRAERLRQAEAQLREIDAQLAEMEIAAPTNAILEVLHVRLGDVPAPNEPIATLLVANHLWVRVFVPELWLGHIQLGQKLSVKVDSFPEREFTGEVEQIARLAEFTPRNVQTVSDRVRQVFGVRVRLPHETGLLRAGMAADVTFPNVPLMAR